MTETDVLELEEGIKKAAKFVSFQWPGVIDAGDAEQAIWLHLLERPGSIEKIRDMDDKARYRAIVGVGNQIASKERTEYAYYKGSYRYSVAEVKAMLKSGALQGLELDPEVQVYDAGGDKPVGGGSKPPVSVAVLDLREGFSALRERRGPGGDPHGERYAAAITKRYLLGTFPETQQEKDALKNGIPGLTNEMNRSNRINRYS